MTDVDDLRVALREGNCLPDDVRARPEAAVAIRQLARRRHFQMIGGAAAALTVCLLATAAVAGTIGPGGQSTTVPGTSAGRTSATPTSTVPTVAPGRRTLATPIELRPVERTGPGTDCTATSTSRVKSADGSNCYVLAPASMVLKKVRDLATGQATNPQGTMSEGWARVDVTMTAADTASFSQLTRELVGKQLALVVGGKVYTAPTIASEITGGTLEIILDSTTARLLLVELTN